MGGSESTEIKVQAQVAHYLERRVVIRAKIDRMIYSTLGLLSTVSGHHHQSTGECGQLLLVRNVRASVTGSGNTLHTAERV